MIKVIDSDRILLRKRHSWTASRQHAVLALILRYCARASLPTADDDFKRWRVSDVTAGRAVYFCRAAERARAKAAAVGQRARSGAPPPADTSREKVDTIAIGQCILMHHSG